MAKITCKYCRMGVRSGAKGCPFCGARPTAARGVYLVLFAALGVWLAFLAAAGGGRTADKPVPDNPRDHVLAACQDFIKDSLQDPSAAEFDHDPPAPAVLPGDLYRVTVSLRAKNGLGGMHRVPLECTVKLVDGKAFRLVGLTEIPH